MADERLTLEKQLCFPLYAAAREAAKLYRPHLDPLGLTYTQYLTLLAVGERQGLSVKEAGERLHLDSGTLTPVLKGLEEKGLVCRRRAPMDERVVQISLTSAGAALRDKAASIPAKAEAVLPLTPHETEALCALLQKLLDQEEQT